MITALDKLDLGERLPLRQIEIEKWLADNDGGAQPWVAFDDDESLFEQSCFNLVLCDPAAGLSTTTLDVALQRRGLQVIG